MSVLAGAPSDVASRAGISDSLYSLDRAWSSRTCARSIRCVRSRAYSRSLDRPGAALARRSGRPSPVRPARSHERGRDLGCWLRRGLGTFGSEVSFSHFGERGIVRPRWRGIAGCEGSPPGRAEDGTRRTSTASWAQPTVGDDWRRMIAAISWLESSVIAAVGRPRDRPHQPSGVSPSTERCFEPRFPQDGRSVRGWLERPSARHLRALSFLPEFRARGDDLGAAPGPTRRVNVGAGRAWSSVGTAPDSRCAGIWRHASGVRTLAAVSVEMPANPRGTGRAAGWTAGR